MKAKPIPTSPKNRLPEEKVAEVEAFLKSPPTITQPVITRFSLGFLVVCLLVSFLAGAVSASVIIFGREQWPWLGKWFGNANQEISVITSTGRKENGSENYPETVKKIAKNVVAIYVRQNSVGQNAGVLEQLYLPGDRRGLGVLLTEDGLGVTVKSAIPDLKKEVAVITDDKTVYLTKQFISDPASDLVLFRISGKGFPVIDFAESQNLIIPQTVLELSRQTTTQTISAALPNLIALSTRHVVDRENLVESTEKFVNFHQTNSDIQTPGLPVFSLNGKLVGLHTGVDGEVIPVGIVAGALESYNKTGAITRNYFGVKYLDLSLAKGLLLSPAEAGENGALLTTNDTTNRPAVDPKGPAGRAGLKAGDVITKINDVTLNEGSILAEVIQAQANRSTVTVHYERSGKTQSVPVTLETVGK